MNGRKWFSAILIAFFVITGLVGANNAVAFGPGGHGGFGDPLFGFLHRLDLNDAQKKIVADAFATNNWITQLQSDATAVATDRAAVTKAILAGGTPDTTQLAADQAALMQLRVSIISTLYGALKSTLSTEQQQIISNMESKIGTNISARVSNRFAHLQNWINKHQ